MSTHQSVPEPVVAVVVAAGSGVRLGGDRPKALREVAGTPLVVHAVDAMIAGGCEQVVVVASADIVDEVTTLLAGRAVPVTVCVGGSRRQDSVSAGLAALDLPDAVVLVHDAARPLVPAAMVRRVVDAVTSGAVAVVPVLPIVDSIRQVLADGTSVVVDRSRLRSVQTPQGFRLAALRVAHAAVVERHLEVTDDAAACEAVGHQVTLVEGSPAALKITTASDLVLAEALLAERS